MDIKIYGVDGGTWQFSIPKFSNKFSRVLNWNAAHNHIEDAFKDFNIHGVECVRTLLTIDGEDTTDDTLTGGYKYACTFHQYRKFWLQYEETPDTDKEFFRK